MTFYKTIRPSGTRSSTFDAIRFPILHRRIGERACACACVSVCSFIMCAGSRRHHSQDRVVSSTAVSLLVLWTRTHPAPHLRRHQSGVSYGGSMTCKHEAGCVCSVFSVCVSVVCPFLLPRDKLSVCVPGHPLEVGVASRRGVSGEPHGLHFSGTSAPGGSCGVHSSCTLPLLRSCGPLPTGCTILLSTAPHGSLVSLHQSQHLMLLLFFLVIDGCVVTFNCRFTFL